MRVYCRVAPRATTCGSFTTSTTSCRTLHANLLTHAITKYCEVPEQLGLLALQRRSWQKTGPSVSGHVFQGDGLGTA